jgi:hypothetical protein
MSIREEINMLSDSIHDNARDHGFWEELKPNIPEKLALVHCEVAEATEAFRVRPELLQDEHCPEFLNAEVEIADAIIRLLDLSSHLRFDIGGAILAKHEYNKGRPYKHGKTF